METIFETLGQMVEELEKDELLDFMVHYNNYIVHFYESHDNSCYPVSMLEYFNNDYMAMINELYN